MKKEYTKPEILISLFTTEDIMTPSVTKITPIDAIDLGDGGGGSGDLDYDSSSDFHAP